MFLSGGPLMLFGVDSFGEEFAEEIVELVGGGKSRRRRMRRRLEEDDLLVPVRPETISPEGVVSGGAFAKALGTLQVPAQTDVALASPHEIAVLIKRAQEKEEEALMMILSEVM